MKYLAKYAIFAVFGALLGELGYPVTSWQWWAWELALIITLLAREHVVLNDYRLARQVYQSDYYR